MDSTGFVLLFSTAIQQAVELIEALYMTFTGTTTSIPANAKRALAFLFSSLTVWGGYAALPKIGELHSFLSGLIWAVALSAGTDGVNSILKYLNYKKEDKKAEAAATSRAAGATAIRAVERGSLGTVRSMALAPSRRPVPIEDRVVTVVEQWSGSLVRDTTTELQTLWLGGPHSSVPLNPAGLQDLCARQSNEFENELDLSQLTPASFSVAGGSISTVEDLIEEVVRA